jgi:1-aminocyclopropane-1-carboxylate deaminase
MINLEQSIVQEVQMDSLSEKGIRLFIKRDDLIHHEVSGNKWRKLQLNIEHAVHQKKEGILTFGGAYSNHLLATASACRLYGLRSIGIVRGEELTSSSNPTLKRCEELGMELLFVSREEYGMRNEKMYQEELSYRFSLMHIVPEGGANYLGMIGCQQILKETNNDYDLVAVAQGTTATSCGVLTSISAHTRLWVVPVLKGFDSLSEMNKMLLGSGFEKEMIFELFSQMEVLGDYHFGGYASYNKELLDLIEGMYRQNDLPLDPIYTGKAMFALLNEIEKRDLRNIRVMFIHTGGIQGAKAIFEKEKRDIF